jgi:hypothetical protein
MKTTSIDQRTSPISTIGTRMLRNVATAMALVGLLCGSHHRASANPVFELADGGNWDLPIVSSMNAIVQRGIYQSSGTSYNAEGKEVSGPSVTQYIGITSFIHLFSFDALPKVGFFWEVFLPVADIQLQGSIPSLSGLGDPLVALTAYMRPIPNLLLGLQNFTSIPVGSNELTSHRFENYPNIIFDYEIGRLGFDGTYGMGVFAAQHAGIDSVRSGNQLIAETAMRYQLTNMFAPFIVNTYQSQDSGTTVYSNAHIPGNHQDDLGGGVKISFSHKRWFSIYYYSSISGENTRKTNALYLKFANIF